jgi:copper homeostasis protein (lipoprotein)
MRTFRQKFKETLACSLFIVIFAGHSPAFAETAETKDAQHHEQHSMDWPGIYNGFLPCADCIGLKTSLALNKNNSYVLITQYVGKSPRDFVEKGKFSWSDKSNTIVLTSRDGSTTHQYLVGENVLIQLDNNGNRITGKQADNYILRRTDVTSEPQSHSSH